MADDLGSSLVRTDFGELSDAELVRATRQGSRRAYAALWKRHSVSALKYAKTLTASDADDVVSEAFLKVYAAIKAGRGPEEDFRYYIRSAVRNTYVSMVRASRSAPAGDAIEDVVGDRGAEVASVRSFDGSATARAFLSLPARWQEVLWYTEVEGLSRERTAAVLGMNANAVSALSFRAREALRTAWLQEHISTRSDLDRGCEAITPLLGGYSRRGLSRRDRLRVEHHLNACAHCTSVVQELSELLAPGRLALVLLPVALAGGGFAAFASKMGGGSAVLASATTIATPTATVVATVGGSAASGAAALTVVGKVAACALVATMIVPPTQLLIEAAHHPVRQSESASAHTDVSSAHGPALQLEIAVAAVDDAEDEPTIVADPETDASPDDRRADGWSRAEGAWRAEEAGPSSSAAEHADFGSGVNPDPRTGGGGGGEGGRPSTAGTASPDPVDRTRPIPNPKASESGETASSGKADPSAAGVGAPTADKKASEDTVPARANPSGALSASAGQATKPTQDADAAAQPNGNAHPNAGGSAAGDKANENAGGPAPAGGKANENAGGSAAGDKANESPADPAGPAANAGAGGPADTAANAGADSSGAGQPTPAGPRAGETGPAASDVPSRSDDVHAGTAPAPADTSAPRAAAAHETSPASAGLAVAAGASSGG